MSEWWSSSKYNLTEVILIFRTLSQKSDGAMVSKTFSSNTPPTVPLLFSNWLLSSKVSSQCCGSSKFCLWRSCDSHNNQQKNLVLFSGARFKQELFRALCTQYTCWSFGRELDTKYRQMSEEWCRGLGRRWCLWRSASGSSSELK